MDFRKISISWYLAYLRVLMAQKQCSKFQNFGLSIEGVIETQKCTQTAWPAQFLSIFNILWQLRGVITFEWIISLSWNFQDILISYIPFIWKRFIRIWDGLCPNLWNFVLFDMEWPNKKYICPVFRRWCVLPPEVIFVKAFWSKKTPCIVHKGYHSPHFKIIPLFLTPPPSSPTLPANWSFQVCLINRNVTVKQCTTTTEHWL